jgi:hypothetical protein
MSHTSSQWSHVDDNVVRKGKDLPESEIKANKADNVKVDTIQDAARPPADERIRDEAPSTPTSGKKRQKKEKAKPKENEVMDHSWKDAYRAMFKDVLTKKDISQIIRILEKLELKSEFVLNDQGLMYYKGQFVGNAILTFYYLFKSDKNRLRLAKQVNKLRKMLEKNDISLHV